MSKLNPLHLVGALAVSLTALSVQAAEPVKSLRLYAIDCGRIDIADMGAFDDAGSLDGKPGMVAAPCFLIRHPKGNLIWDAGLGDGLAEKKDGVTNGGFHGLGNTRFKSSTNRAPRRASPGTKGERRDLRLELSLLADVGLLGMPNAGKSTLLGAVSAARPKIADYPFTTLYPQPGVVSVGLNRSFVMVDVPGLIEGAAGGAGLGIRFLKHLQRTRLLLHLVDVLPPDGGDIVEHIETINAELAEFSEELAGREQWLLFNKLDLLPADEADQLCDDALERLGWTGRSYRISAAQRTGLDVLCRDAMEWVEAHAPPRETPDAYLLLDTPNPTTAVHDHADHEDDADQEPGDSEG